MSNRVTLIAKIGAAAAALVVSTVAFYEGTVLRTYRDPIGIVTACTGNTGPELRMGQTFTKEQCTEMLYVDLLKHAQALECVKRPMSDGQKAAFLSFSFNVGNGAFCSSTLVRKANAGDMPGACAELSRWTYAGGKQLLSLIKRRAAERKLCEEGM